MTLGSDDGRGSAGASSTVRAWDLPTRLFHWSLVACIAAAWTTSEFAEALGDATLKLHRSLGLAVLVLLVWRLLWGLVGSSTSRFSAFVRSPAAALAYGRDLAAGRSRHYLGHNPLGAFMVLALLAVVAAQAGLGLFTAEHNDLADGPLVKFVAEGWLKTIRHWHHGLFQTVLLPLVGLHIAANVLYGLVKGDPLILAMLTGRKPAARYADAAEARLAPTFRALACLVLAAVLVLAPLKLVAGRLL